MTPSIFIGHFAHDEFADAEAIRASAPSNAAKRSMDAAAELGAPSWGLPLLAYQASGMSGSDSAQYAKAKFRSFLAECGERNLGFAIELARGNAFGGLEAFKSMLDEQGLRDVKLILDTGHAFVCGEDLLAVPASLQASIAATHVCDTNPGSKESLPPGQGKAPLEAAIRALLASGWKGSLDLEISCAAGEARKTYKEAREALARKVAGIA